MLLTETKYYLLTKYKKTNMTKIFFDTEFTGLHQKTTLISIGLVSECGCTFYAEFTDYDKTQVDTWLEENVISKLKHTDKIKPGVVSSWEHYISDTGKYSDALDMALSQKDMRQFECIGSTPMIRNRLEKWLSQFEHINMWSDCLSYDWVLFNQIFDHAFNLPKNIFYIPFDICTLMEQNGIDPDISRESFISSAAITEKDEIFPYDETIGIVKSEKHNALWDAYVIKNCYEKIKGQ